MVRSLEALLWHVAQARALDDWGTLVKKRRWREIVEERCRRKGIEFPPNIEEYEAGGRTCW